MVPRRVLDGTTTADGRELELIQQGDAFLIEIDRVDLMSSREHSSEEAMAGLTLEAWGRRDAPRWLVGGLGMGFTLRACLDALDRCRGGSVVVAEVFEAVVAWNRGPLGHLASHPLEDPRVEVVVGDVFDRLEPSAFDIILLDVDNGPEALTLGKNGRLYRAGGLDRLRRSLRPGGVLAVWSAGDDPGFRDRLARSGFRVDAARVRSRPGNKGGHHTIFLGTVAG